jgi:hypothetical protein
VRREAVSPYLGMEPVAPALEHAGVATTRSVSSLTRAPTLLYNIRKNHRYR